MSTPFDVASVTFQRRYGSTSRMVRVSCLCDIRFRGSGYALALLAAAARSSCTCSRAPFMARP
jgi:hypothetical protein